MRLEQRQMRGAAVELIKGIVEIDDIQRRFSSVRFGVDFFASNRSTLSLTQNIVGGKFSNEEEQDQEYFSLHQGRYRRLPLGCFLQRILCGQFPSVMLTAGR